MKQAEWSGPPAAAAESSSALCDQWFMREKESSIKFGGIHHVAIICANFERSLEFYCGLLGEDASCVPLKPNVFLAGATHQISVPSSTGALTNSAKEARGLTSDPHVEWPIL